MRSALLCHSACGFPQKVEQERRARSSPVPYATGFTLIALPIGGATEDHSRPCKYRPFDGSPSPTGSRDQLQPPSVQFVVCCEVSSSASAAAATLQQGNRAIPPRVSALHMSRGNLARKQLAWPAAGIDVPPARVFATCVTYCWWSPVHHQLASRRSTCSRSTWINDVSCHILIGPILSCPCWCPPGTANIPWRPF